MKGDRIELIERDDDFGDGWYLGRHTRDGRTGLFPEGKPLEIHEAVLEMSANQLCAQYTQRLLQKERSIVLVQHCDHRRVLRPLLIPL
jgi:hypothetical protein